MEKQMHKNIIKYCTTVALTLIGTKCSRQFMKTFPFDKLD